MAGRVQYTPPEHAAECLLFSPDGKSLAVTTDRGELHLLRLGLGGPLRSLKPGYPPDAFAFTPDGRAIAVRSGFAQCTLFDVETGAALWTFAGHPDGVNCLAFSPDGTLLAVGCGGQGADWRRKGGVRVWETKTGKQLVDLP